MKYYKSINKKNNRVIVKVNNGNKSAECLFSPRGYVIGKSFIDTFGKNYDAVVKEARKQVIDEDFKDAGWRLEEDENDASILWWRI